MSTATSAAVAAQVTTRPAGARAHRPTTYSGVSPTATAAAAAATYSTPPSSSQGGPPIPPPPRTSSQRQVPTGGNDRGRSNSATRAQNGSSTRDREREKRERAEVASSNGTSHGRASSSRQEQQRPGSSRRADTAPSNVNESSSSRRREENAIAAGMNSEGQVQQPSSGTARRKELRFGEYILGQTLGEGEFGKVKLGWRRDDRVQVAIKLIRRDTLTPHPNRLSKIYREIAILRELHHPNIVKLHEMVETERHIGIILEYASGGELFDYILNHKYLKDPPACRLFAQLVSGVGYLHKKGIVHRDLKLENLLLDRNRNIIITDFGFANVFNPSDELGEDVEARLDDTEFIKQLEREHANKDSGGQYKLWDELVTQGQVRRRGDLMATSCGSPCYAAPELVVSDGLYTGRKVDVWSCGVILYAMLAGYLPFDDDPANPDGDNINLLYKYIVTTPLTFPEYVSPHARDLLRRILVPDPRKRADLFEVARHSWLSPYANVVSMITSGTTKPEDIANTTVSNVPEQSSLNRSASVREPATTTHPHASVIASSRTHDAPKVQADAKRNTVQVEYTQPSKHTERRRPEERRERREEKRPEPKSDHSNLRQDVRQENMDFADKLVPQQEYRNATITTERTRPQNDRRMPESQKARPVTYGYPDSSKPQRRESTKDRSRPPVSANNVGDSSQRPTTSSGVERMTSRGAYGKPTAPATTTSLATTVAKGQMQQPTGSRSGKMYHISGPMPVQDDQQRVAQTIQLVPAEDQTQNKPLPPDPNHTSTAQVIAERRQEALQQQQQEQQQQQQQQAAKGHKRANTIGAQTADRFFGRLGFMSSSGDGSGRTSVDQSSPRHSIDRPSRKDREKGPPVSGEKKGRRFSLLPTSFSLKSFGGGSSSKPPERRPSRSTSGNSAQQRRAYQEARHADVVRTGNSSYPHLGVPTTTQMGGSGHNSILTGSDTSLAQNHDGRDGPVSSAPQLGGRGGTDYLPPLPNASTNLLPDNWQQVASQQQQQQQLSPLGNPPMNSEGMSEQKPLRPPNNPVYSSVYLAPQDSNANGNLSAPTTSAGLGITIPQDQSQQQRSPSARGHAVLTKNRKFNEGYEDSAQHGGSSSAARRVMDFFRKRSRRER